MRVELITEDKEDFMDILLIADPEEAMIRKYLDKGDLFALYDDEVLRSACVVVILNNRKCELKNLATMEQDRGKGYATHLVNYISEYYAGSCDIMYVGTGNIPKTIEFYQHLGFEKSHIKANFFITYYEQPIYEDGRRLRDMVYLKKQLESEVNLKRVVDLALKAGELLLQNGGEIFRVEETMDRICNRFYVDKVDTFVISHAIIISVRNGESEAYTRVRHIPLQAAHLGIVTEVNDLSRQISAGKIGMDEAFHRLDEIEKMPPTRDAYTVLAAGCGSGFFGFLLGATPLESVFAFFIGAIMYIWVILAKRHGQPKIIVNMIGGVIITALALAAYNLPLVPRLNLSGMIIGAIMPLVPGAAFVNAIRDIADSDFLSGTVRMIDALLVFVYIAIGVGVALGFYNNMFGGAVL